MSDEWHYQPITDHEEWPEMERRCRRQRRSSFVTGVITGSFVTGLFFVWVVFA